MPRNCHRSRLRSFRRDRAGNIIIIVALVLPVLLGALGLGAELGHWYLLQRDMQNAADSASMAAANNKTNYQAEAIAVSAQYGYISGIENVLVVVTGDAPCPAGELECYQVTISKPIALYLSRFVGFKGSITVNGEPMQLVSSTALTRRPLEKRQYCLLTLAGLPGQSSAQGVTCSGCPSADLAGCNIMSNNDMRCTGSTTNADVGDAAGENRGCGNIQHSNMPPLADPYANLASFIPADPCAGAYPQASSGTLPATNRLSGTIFINGNVSLCGDVELTSDVAVSNTVGDGGVLILWNGRLITNGHKLGTITGYLTLVFTGTNGPYAHVPTDSGTLDFSAPRSGNWAGMALYQHPALISGVDLTAAGNTPTFNITGMMYMPHAEIRLSGAVNKASTNGLSCFGIVADNMLINGTGLSLAACDRAGLGLPYTMVEGRAILVQ